jgi:Skp family chaperone for outer membrane proteins
MSMGNCYRCLVIGIFLYCLMQPGCSRRNSPTESASVESSPALSVTQSPSGIATIDVNQIARDSGVVDHINRELQKAESELNLILAGRRKIHLAALESLRKAQGNPPTQAQLKQLEDLRIRQAAEYNLKWQETRAKLSAIKKKHEAMFLSQVQPVAMAVAKQQGLNVVIRQENVFCLVDPDDITEAVLAEYQQRYPRDPKPAVTKVSQVPPRGGEFVPRK